jgi:hypothetical protein
MTDTSHLTNENILQALGCGVPVLYDNTKCEKQYRLSMFGSAILCDFCGTLFLVAAKHTICGDEGEKAPNIGTPVCFEAERLEYHISQDTFAIERVGNPDNESADIVLGAMGRNYPVCEHKGCPHPITLKNCVPFSEPTISCTVYCQGFPDGEGYFDYAGKTCVAVGVCIRGELIGPTEREYIYQVKFEGAIENFNGLSGSPLITEDPPGKIRLLGMLIRATGSSQLGYFVDARHIVNQIAATVREIREGKHNEI